MLQPSVKPKNMGLCTCNFTLVEIIVSSVFFIVVKAVGHLEELCGLDSLDVLGVVNGQS